jgi:hypothetical protein
MIRHRMLGVLKMSGSVARSELQIDDAKDGAGGAPVLPAASFSAAYARDIIGKPLWQYGPILKRAMRRPLLTPEELMSTTKAVVATAPFTTIIEALGALQAVQNTTVAEVVALAQDTQGFVPTYRRVLERIAGTEQPMDTPNQIARVVAQEGAAKVMTLISVARVANNLPKASLLNLRQLCLHSFSTAITAFEIGRLLNLENNFLLSAAALVHDSGRWLFAIGEPGVYALALALAEDDKLSVEEVEAALFGMDHHQAGQQLMSFTGQPALIQAAVSFHHDPTKVAERDFIVTATVVHLAHLLAQASIAGSAVEAKTILNRLREPNYVAWNLLQERSVKLPLEIPELVDTLSAIANTGNWSAHQFMGG